MGSATVMLLCGTELPQNVKGAVADCGYTSVRDEFAYHLHKMHVPRFPVIETVDLWTKCFAGYRFVDVRPIDAVRRAKLPMLFIHGEADDFVPTEMVYDLYEACGSEKYLLTVPGAGHSESYQKNSALYEDAFGAFLERCFAKETVS